MLVHCRLGEVLELMYPEIHVVTRDEWVQRDRWKLPGQIIVIGSPIDSPNRTIEKSG